MLHNFSAAAKDSIFNNSYKRDAGIHQCPTLGCSEAQWAGRGFVACRTAHQHSPPQQKASGSLQGELRLLKMGTYKCIQGKANQHNGSGCERQKVSRCWVLMGEILHFPFFHSLGETAVHCNSAKTSQETTAILQLSFFPLVFGVSTYKWWNLSLDKSQQKKNICCVLTKATERVLHNQKPTALIDLV